MKNTLKSGGLRNLRLSRGFAQRQVANESGVDIATVRRLETLGIGDSSTFSVAQLIHIADYLNVEVGHLFEIEPSPTPSTKPEPSDVQLLGAILFDLGKSTKTKAVSEVLGWNSTKIHEVANDLDRNLALSGLTLLHSRGRLLIHPLSDNHQPAADKIRKHPLATISQRIITPQRARLIYEMENAPKSRHALTEASRQSLALLCRVGLVDEDGLGNFIVSDTVMRSLYPEGFTRVKALNRKQQTERARLRSEQAQTLDFADSEDAA